jgi:phenylpropionate dioxygenase-like ring-hydroxylating dioxygenase large terminal subunit
VQQESEFFDLDKEEYGLSSVHCEVWSGFIFINVAERPEQTLMEFLGPMVTNLEGYPFDRMTARFGYRTNIAANWKLFMDAFSEFYHAPVLHASQSPAKYSTMAYNAGFEAPHYRIERPHRLVSTSGVRFWEMDQELVKPMEILTRSGLFGPWDQVDLGPMPPGVNPAGCEPWGLDSFQLFPNFVILIWVQGWYLTYHYWPTSHGTHVFEGNVYFLPATNVRERIAQEMAAVTFKEFALQDANTLEATQIGIESGYVEEFLLNDQEVLCRALHKEVADWIHDAEASEGATSMEVRR